MSWELSAQQIGDATKSKFFGSCVINGVSTDSREPLKGKLFVALKGERFDAHDFIEAAINNGATAILFHDDRPGFAKLKSKAVFFKVEDTLEGLQDLARYWRRKNNFQVVGITGSNGKTSSKEFTYQLLKDFKPTYASKGSFNNHWGVPLSILGASSETRLLILEMGMNHLGELEWLTQIAEPNVTVVTMVGPSHIGELGSQENIAKAKEEIYRLAPRSIAIFNSDNSWTSAMLDKANKEKTHSRIITFSSHGSGHDVGLRAEKMSSKGLELAGHIGDLDGHCSVKVFGRHNLTNLMVACSVALAVGMTPKDIWARLESLVADAWGRNQWLKGPNGSSILFDAYNANPSSMEALLKNIYELEIEGRKILILGEMLELGKESGRMHDELGALLSSVGADIAWFIGPHHDHVKDGMERAGFAGIAYYSQDFDETISSEIKNSLKASDLVALKASRGQKLETVLEHWGIKP